MDIQEIVTRVRQNWQFDEEKYPVLKFLDEDGRRNFAIKHVLLHIQKSAGKIAEQCEAADHGEKLSLRRLEVAACKLVVKQCAPS